ncbi:MAG: type VI secretion system tube protein Hcp [Aquisalimonadaceae bacterium]
MNYEGIKGESSDKGHVGWMDIYNIKWGVKRRITSNTSTQSDRESSNAEITDLTLARHMDSATPGLFIESCCGKGKDVIIHLTKTGTGNGADIFVEYTLKNALISDYKVVASSQTNFRPMEAITISFVDVEIRYTSYDEDGNAMAPVAVSFNTASNEKR